MKIYRFDVSIMGTPGLYRIIDISENCTFEDFHDAIFQAFERFDHHLYSFFITRKEAKAFKAIYTAPEITHPENLEDIMSPGKERKSADKTRIGSVGLKEKDVFYYLFDFGDEWWHRIEVQSIYELNRRRKYIRLVESVGDSPSQYPDYDDDDDDYDKEYD